MSRSYETLIELSGNELAVLTTIDRETLASVAGEQIVDAIIAVREGNVEVNAGFDGVYGTVSPIT